MFKCLFFRIFEGWSESSSERIQPAEEGHQGCIPVDGNFVGRVGIRVVDIRFVGAVGGVGDLHFALVLLSRIGSSHQHPREWCRDVVCSRRPMVWMLRALIAKPRHETVACGVASKEVICVLQGVAAIALPYKKRGGEQPQAALPPRSAGVTSGIGNSQML